jgi:hypothetical protein
MSVRYSFNVTPQFVEAVEHLREARRLAKKDIEEYLPQICKELEIDPTKHVDVTVAAQPGVTGKKIRVYKREFELLRKAGQRQKAVLFFFVNRTTKKVFLLNIKVQTKGQEPIPEPIYTARKSQQERISEKDLIAHIAVVWKHFEKRYIANSVLVGPEFAPYIKISKRFLIEAIKHSCIDMIRMASWHLPSADQNPDRHKFAAFVSKWLAQIRPIFIDADIPLKSSSLHTINARFALWVFRSFLLQPLPANLVANLTYLFHFRQEKGETLALIAYCCEQLSELAPVLDISSEA